MRWVGGQNGHFHLQGKKFPLRGRSVVKKCQNYVQCSNWMTPYRNCLHWPYVTVQCTEVRYASLLSGGFTTVAVINPLEKKLANRTSVQCFEKKPLWISALSWRYFYIKGHSKTMWFRILPFFDPPPLAWTVFLTEHGQKQTVFIPLPPHLST